MPSKGTNCRVLDTRKTTPGLRALEKAAAAAGGVTNHRMGLYDAVLIKNNHIAAAGGVRNAIERVRASGLEIEIEVRTRAELHEALDAGASHLLLDNLTPAEAADWIREIAGRARVELSGGITLDNVRAYAETGADFVSAGAITHSARAMDISFRLELVGMIRLARRARARLNFHDPARYRPARPCFGQAKACPTVRCPQPSDLSCQHSALDRSKSAA